MDCLGAHLGVEFVAELFHRFEVLLVVKQLPFFEIRHAGIGHNKRLKIKDALDVAKRHIEEQAYARRQGFEEPNVCNRTCQFDVSHTVTANLRKRYFDAAFFANDAAMLKSLVLTAQALVVFCRAENFGAEQTIALRLECPIVNCLWLFHFAE